MNNIDFEIDDYFYELNKVANLISKESIEILINQIISTIEAGNTIFTCGNGGSANTASHYIVDWVKMYSEKYNSRFKAYSLNDNLGVITAYANDLTYDHIYSMQLKSLGTKNDLMILISGSGNSKNVLNAVETAKLLEIKTTAIVGYDGGELKKVTDHHIHVPSFDMQICEDLHLAIGHIIMKKLCKRNLIQ